MAWAHNLLESSPVFSVLDGANARNIVRHVFLVFGQLKSLDLPSSGKRRVTDKNLFPDLSGYPFWTRGVEVGSELPWKLPLTYIGRSGLSPDRTYSVEELRQISIAAYQFVNRLLGYIFKSEGADFELSFQPGTDEQTEAEGLQIISRVDDELYRILQSTREVETEVERLLTQHTREELVSFISFDFESQLYVISSAKMHTNIDMKKFFQELKAVKAKRGNVGNGCLYLVDHAYFNERIKECLSEVPVFPKYTGSIKDFSRYTTQGSPANKTDSLAEASTDNPDVVLRVNS